MKYSNLSEGRLWGKAVLKDMHLGIIDPQNLFAETEETENEAPIPEEKKKIH